VLSSLQSSPNHMFSPPTKLMSIFRQHNHLRGHNTWIKKLGKWLYPIISIRVTTKPTISKLRWNHSLSSEYSTLATMPIRLITWPWLLPTLECLHVFFWRPLRLRTVYVLLKIT
jgi:hypothetical protein